MYLCTSCEWNTTQIQDRFEELKNELEKASINLVKWDKLQLSRSLKTQPQIVYDFFGSEWVKKFNGEIALQQISKSKKLDANQIVRYRQELYDFYSKIFNNQDPGIPIKELNSPYTIQDRFIIPDILSNVKGESFESSQDTPASSPPSNQNIDQLYYDDFGYELNENQYRLRKVNLNDVIEDNNIDVRIKVDDALINNNKNIIIGDPGSGKSTLLRYIVLDILSNCPQLENISQKYGKSLPVWLPFAFITKHLNQNDSLNISEILKLWFNGFGKKHLFDIANEALMDERLFLVIDGIDEWNNISSAQQAITRIEITRELYDCQVLYSSRPYGFRILKDSFTNLKVLKLAGFSTSQQIEFVRKWYDKWVSLQEDINDQEFTKTQTNNFVKELEQTGDLKKLAETPLLLSILIIQKMRDSVLPKNKLEALKEITQYLINKHPIKRVSDAGIVLEKANDINFKDIFCELAIYIQRESNDGVILKSDALKVIEQYLTTYADYDKVKAKLRSHELLEVGANNFGIIIEKSNDEIAFSHKLFQEFLASQYLFESDDESANEFIVRYASNPTFHQVTTNLFGLIPIKQVKKYKSYFENLKSATHETYQEEYLKLISYEVAINLDNTPTEILNDSFNSIITDFEYETDPLYKEALLRRILNSLQNGRLKERVEEYLIQYIPNQTKYRDYRVNALRQAINLNAQQIEFLKKAFINGTIDVRYDASKVLKAQIKNKQVYDFLKDIITSCANPEILAFAINSVITNDIEQQDIDDLLGSVEVEVPIVQLFLYKYKVFTKKHTADDLQLILRVAKEVSSHLKQEIIEVLIDGYANSEELKEILLKSTQRRFNRFDDNLSVESDISWKLLFHCFNKEKDVIQVIKKEFETEEFPFISDRPEMLRHLVHYFKGNQELIPAVEQWLSRRFAKYRGIDHEIAYACIFMHTEKAKEYLLEDLPKSSISHWHVMALLEGWSEDIDVKGKLKEYFRTVHVTKTSAAAHLAAKVFDSSEKDEAIRLLEGMLFNDKLMFRERAIPSLIEIDKAYFEKNILLRLLNVLESFPKNTFAQYYTALEVITNSFHSDSVVKNYILERVESDIYLYSSLVRHFPEEIAKEEKLLTKSLPLSNELRLQIIDEFNELSTLPQSIESALCDFGKEEQEEVKADMAVCLFNKIKQTNVDKILALSSPLVFATGFDYEVQRNIAFTGFLISKKLDEYFLKEGVEKQKGQKAAPVNILNEQGYRRTTSKLMIQSIVNNFEYLISVTGADFAPLRHKENYNTDIESVWSFFARHSVRSSPSYQYIMDYISDHTNQINSNSIISFLNRTSPNSSILKDILLKTICSPDANNKTYAGRLLGANFKYDSQVYEEVRNVQGNSDNGRIIALCNGWPNEPILKEIFDEIVEDSYPIDNHIGFNLKFLFRDVNNLCDFLKRAFSYPNDTKRYHRYFFLPMIERLKKDSEFSSAIKKLLLASDSINEKISCYTLLSQVNMVDDDVRSWKNKITVFKNDYGYDIVSNKTIRLKNVLYDYYF